VTTEAREKIATRLLQSAPLEDLEEVYVLARMIYTGATIEDLLGSISFRDIIDRFPWLREDLEGLEK
jgi:hypothetical protein